MQISASNLLIASQQTQNAPQPAKAASSFAAALKPQGVSDVKPDFEALPLKKAAPASEPASVAPETQAATGYGGPKPPGFTIDIRV